MFSESHDILLDGSETDVMLVFIDIILSVAASVNIRDVIGADTDGFLIDPSKQLNASFIWMAIWIHLLQTTQFIPSNLSLLAKIGSVSLGPITQKVVNVSESSKIWNMTIFT